MWSALVTILLFGIVILITAMVFVGWVAFAVVRVVVHGIASLFGGCKSKRPAVQQPMRINSVRTSRCQTRGCLAINPVNARFCRRCGQGLPAAARVQVRRAAVW
jgi:hypothetical protein